MSGTTLSQAAFLHRLPVRILLTTALISLGHGAWSQSWLDNVDQTNGTVDPGTGSWAADDAIWSDAAGENHAPLALGGTGILAATPRAPVVLTIDGTVQPGALVIESDGYTLTGGLIANSGSGLAIEVADGVLVDVASELSGDLTLTGGGTIAYAGESNALTTVQIDAGTTLSSIGTTSGALRNDGVFELGGTHDGDVNNQNETVMAGGTVTGMVANGGTFSGSGSVGGLTNNGTVTVAAGDTLTSGNMVVNNSSLSLSGTLDAGLRNSVAGTTVLESGTVTGTVINRGTFSGSGSVGGLTNDGTVTVAAGDTLTSTGAVVNNAALNLAGILDAGLTNTTGSTTVLDGGRVTGAVTNSGSLSGSGSVGGLTNDGTVAVVAGDTLTSTGAVVNNAALAITGTLDADLDNAGAASVTLNGGTVTGTIANSGTLSGSGSVGGLTNDGTTTVAAGDTLISATTVVNNADLAIAGTLNAGLDNATGAATVLNDGAITGAVANSGTFSGSGSVGGLTNDGTVTVAVGDTVTSATAVVNKADLTIAGTLNAELSNAAGGTATLDGGTITGMVTNSGTLSGGGTVAELTNDGTVTVAADETLTSAAVIVNNATLMVAGTLDAGLNNAEGANATLNGGTVTGAVTNAGTLSGSGSVAALINDGSVTIAAGDTLTSAVTVVNTAALTVGGTLAAGLTNTADGTATLSGGQITGAVANSGTLSGSGSVGALTNDGTVTVAAGDTLASASTVVNNADLSIAGTLGAALTNAAGGTARLENGEISGTVANSGALSGSGSVGGLTNAGTVTVAAGDMLTSGTTVVNNADLSIAGTLGADLRNTAGGTAMLDGGTVTGDVTNAGTLTNGGAIVGKVTNTGRYIQTGRIDGSLTTSGMADLAGQIGGDVTFTGGTLNTHNGLTIGGGFDLGADFELAAGKTLTTASTTVADGVTMSLGGHLRGVIGNDGTIAVVGGDAQITGGLRNDGVIRMTNNIAGDQLLITGDPARDDAALSGNGTYELDVDLTSLTADRIVLSNAALTGHVDLALRYSYLDTATLGVGSVTIIDVDDSLGSQNDFTFSAPALPRESERFSYSFEKLGDYGGLSLNAAVNSAYGALSGNIALTQSLIGGVINRPTSPFVVDMAFDDEEKPCGTGGWARATGGWADSTGSTNNGNGNVSSRISAHYYGIQFGGDLACFDGRYDGWNIALGVLGGINDGKTEQPVYPVDPTNPARLLDTMSSVNRSDFRQTYGGVYATASKGAFQADLQYRREITDFTVTNRALYVGGGLGFDTVDFTSKGHTLSGSLSYAVPVGENGWQVVPTAGFAWSTISSDSLNFDEDYRLDFDDSQRKVGFLGGTLSRTMIFPVENAALNMFATGTYYKDFAGASVSTFWREGDDSFVPQRLVSDNLGAYGEISIGANYVKILSAGRSGKPRQFSSSARIDVRSGDSLDSVGVTGQVRWQF
ncbi:MAG: hypothetical protein Q4G49_05475 [Paracoccus sp. (in: a-proteobacteria)]|nr:hypothetical protein [Paracoccus sp. (in: a-proteobacteria)]